MTNEVRSRKAKTEIVEHNERLYLELVNEFPMIPKKKKSIQKFVSEDSELITNFDNMPVFDPYCFILLHLRNRTSENPINIHIPEVCIFHDKSPYDVVHSSKGHIRGYKMSNPNSRMRLKDVYKIFKDAWANYNLPKNQTIMSCFLNQEVLMLSENDLYLVCCKTKADPFFKKIKYIQNKVSTKGNPPIKVQYPPIKNPEQPELISDLYKMATQNLLGFQNQLQIQQRLPQQTYLQFLNEKISLFLTYEHNIRINHAIFTYVKDENNHYYFMNIEKLRFTNLSAAILERKNRLKMMEEQRNKVLIMTPEKEKRYKSYENTGMAKNFQRTMNGHFNTIVRRLNLNTVSDNKREEFKNELAFKKLHPRSKFTYNQVITSDNFLKTKSDLFDLSKRKPITIPSRRVMKFYNQVKPLRIKTDSTDILSVY